MLAATIFDRVESIDEPHGSQPALWFGQRPGGGVYLHPHGLDFPPAWVSVNSRGQLTICGTWKSYPAIAHHDSYAELAAALGQSHLDGARGVVVASLDLDGLCPILLECAVAINAVASASAKADS